jgi:pantetheine-phosphate adenylyltransferase
MAKIAVFPGTFDPFTNGHYDIILKGLRIFDEIVIAIGMNALKKSMFPVEKRMEWIENIFEGDDRVKVQLYSGLTTEYCKDIDAQYILRGLRTATDFEYERQIALVNENLNDDVVSVFVMSDQKNSIISSTIVRDLIRHNGAYEQYLPVEVKVDEVPHG